MNTNRLHNVALVLGERLLSEELLHMYVRRP